MKYYSHKSIRKLIAALLETFSDIQIERRDKNGNILAHSPIPLLFGSNDRTTILRKQDLEQLKAGNYNSLPRGALNIVSVIKDLSRNTNRLSPIFTSAVSNINQEYDHSLNSAAYDITFELIFISRTMTDATVIMETVLPRFNPTLNIRYKELDIDITESSVPIALDTVELSVDNDFSENNIRLITTTFYIRAKSNLYHPITNVKLIDEFVGKVKAITDEEKYIDIKDATSYEDVEIIYP